MRTVQMTLDDELIVAVDRIARRLHTSRSAFTRTALSRALRAVETRELERKHERGYRTVPAAAGEFDLWEDEQAWGDE